MGRLFFDFVLKEWLEVGINLANAHIPCLIVLNQLEVDAAEGQNTDNVQHCRYCAEKVGDLPDKAGRKASSIQQLVSAQELIDKKKMPEGLMSTEPLG